MTVASHPLQHVTIYTDGACRSNPGPGGYGGVILGGFRAVESARSSGIRSAPRRIVRLSGGCSHRLCIRQTRGISLAHKKMGVSLA